MKIKTINKKGDWSFPWTGELKNAVENSTNNTIVGESLLLETDEFKVWSIHLPVGKSLPFHKHNKPYFYTIENKGKSRSFYADGTVTETEYKNNDIKHFLNSTYKRNF
jgi:hypothetical protein